MRRRAVSLADKPFLVSDNGVLRYAEFDANTEIIAAALLRKGLQPGDRAIFQMGTIEETLSALFGCYKAGIIPVCTLPQHREHEISTMIALTKPRAYFVQSDFSPSFNLSAFATQMTKKYGNIESVIPTGNVNGSISDLSGWIDYPTAKSIVENIKVSPCDVLTFQLSGGSTGVPKIIPRFHGEYLGQASSMVRRHRLSLSETALWPLPLIHNAAMVLMVFPILLAGGTLVLQRKFDRDTFLDAIEAHKITYAGSIGPIAQSLLDVPHSSKRDLASMRMFFVLDRADAIERHLAVPTTNLYGITEGLLMTGAPEDTEKLRLHSSGYPTGPNDEVQVLHLDGEKAVSEGMEGELCFRGPHMIRGYFDAPKLNAGTFTKGGFFRTGDLVRWNHIDGKVSYTFLGRLKDNISRGGEKFAAEEVERKIVEHPSILDAKVIAMPDRLLGEKACAFVIVRKGYLCPHVDELGRFLTDYGLARYKHPERIEIVDAFPVTRVGKVDKAEMRNEIARRIQLETGALEVQEGI
ncbi:AMP-binding protein [Agrobacterium sp. LMR679]|uniref:AMP-binding protein n=1 Tax=Agrobacterium sp. LMR679 TaxID=3014335 RepID=UPI0022AED682|nr:AMP-binding protein [Agrobacterium sp. LMR679]MCZ4072134.1 AMP-binding protein [Agrobacterium sp. LMR679]